MADLEELEGRVARLERAVAEVQQDAAAARVLAGAADRDVSGFREELRAHTRTLNALRETQIEQGRQLSDQGRQLDELQQQVQEGFSTLNTGMAQIVALLRPEQDGD
ncbi:MULTISPECIES: hypothetical protein [Amycolatopsis]|uniref:Uncharacterized protein n=1 Tax=Amycolatopsis echigonensis TaxID=2576905 RepID=A0A2N3WUX4_9PSEU|nr:hypothetical protein [Amycolatopsis niigatensis]PKV97682.1 hypothetical protein ATK30_8677 [Amycolatopsis niigatensis]